MATHNGWNVSSARVPLGSYMMPQVRKVRTKDGIFQVQHQRSLPLPYGDSFSIWVEDMKVTLGDLEDSVVDYENANEEYSTEINATGWLAATPEQLAVLENHNFG